MEPKLMPECMQNGREETKRNQHEQKLLQNQAVEISIFDIFYVAFSLKNGINGHGALVGLTNAKGSSVDKLFCFFEFVWGEM